MKIQLSNLVLAVALLSLGGLGHAEKADRLQKTIIQCDDSSVDDLQQVRICTGDVVVTKGTLILRGAKLELREDPQGYEYATVTAKPGQAAFFRQKREAVDEYMEAEALKIEYDGKADTVKLIQNAKLRRLRGASLADEANGALIVYNNTSDQYTVNGRLAGTAANGGRVRLVLAPAAAASAPTKDAVLAPQLRPSSQLGGSSR